MRKITGFAFASFLYSGAQLALSGFLVTYLFADVGMTLLVAGTRLAIQGFGAAEFGRGLIALQHDVPALVVTGVAVLAPIAAAIVAGMKLGVVRRAPLAPSEA